MKENPKISVIIPVYNHRRFLRHSIESVLREGIENLQLIVVDDASTDSSVETIGDLPVQIIKLSRHSGVSVALNHGIRSAQGEMISILNSDDVLIPSSLLWRMQWLVENPLESAVGGVLGNMIDEEGSTIGTYESVFGTVYDCPEYLDLSFLQQGGAFSGSICPFIFRSSLVNRIGFFDESLEMAEDCDYLLRILNATRIRIFPKPTFHYRLHGSNTVVRKEGGKHTFRQEARCAALWVGVKYGTVK